MSGVGVTVIGHCIAPNYGMNPLLKHTDMAIVLSRDHIVLPATHTRTIPAFSYSPAAEHRCPLAGTHCGYPRTDGQAEF